MPKYGLITTAAHAPPAPPLESLLGTNYGNPKIENSFAIPRGVRGGGCCALVGSRPFLVSFTNKIRGVYPKIKPFEKILARYILL